MAQLDMDAQTIARSFHTVGDCVTRLWENRPHNNNNIPSEHTACDQRIQALETQVTETSRLISNTNNLLEQFGKKLTTMNENIAGLKAELNGLRRGVADIKTELKWDVTDLKAEFNELRGDVADLKAELKGDVAGLDTGIRERLDYYNRLAHARAMNTPAHEDRGPIYPIPLPNGEYPPAGLFPEDAADFKQLDEPMQLSLLELYELPIHDDPIENHQELAFHCGIRW